MFSNSSAPKYILGFLLIIGAVSLSAANTFAENIDKVTYCHATGTSNNPYKKITISANASSAHEGHEGDFIIPENGSCTAPTATPTPTVNVPTNTPTPTVTTPTPTNTPTPTLTDTPTPTLTPTPAPTCDIHDTNPLCNNALLLGAVPGDAPGTTFMIMGADEAWYKVRVLESSASIIENDITANISLQSPPGIDYDLYVRCLSCTNPNVLSSTNGAGLVDSISVGRDDSLSLDDSFDLFVEVRYFGAGAGAVCGNWTLSVNGNVATSNRSCN